MSLNNFVSSGSLGEATYKMMHKVLWRRRQHAALLLTVVLSLAAPSTAWAQYVTSTGVNCGTEVVSFDTLNRPTEGANAARLQELSKLYVYASLAWEACAANPDTYPGCWSVNEWRKTRTQEAWDTLNLWRRSRLRTLDADLPLQAMRVLAHKRCDGLQDQLPQACAELASAEASAKGIQLCDSSIDQRNQEIARLAPRDAVSSDQRYKILQKDAAVIDEVTAVVEKSKKNCLRIKPACEAGDQRNATSYDIANFIAKARTFYVPPALPPPLAICPSRTNSSHDISEDIARQIDDMPFDRPVLTLLPADATAAAAGGSIKGAIYEALRTELNSVRNNLIECQKATFYVTPSGILLHQDLPSDGTSPVLCIDSSSFAVDRPFDVEVNAYSAYLGDKDSTRIPTITKHAWPGDSTPLIDSVFRDPTPTVARVTVRGYPRGISLRALAQRGDPGTATAKGTAFPKSYETSDLLTEARNVGEVKLQLAADEAKVTEMDALATAIAKDETIQKANTTMNEAVIAAVGAAPTDTAKLLGAARTAVDNAGNAISTFLEQYGKNGRSEDHPSLAAAIAEAKKSLPPGLSASTNTMPLIQQAQAKVSAFPLTVQNVATSIRANQSNATSVRDALSHKLTRLCRISKQLIPVVDEDILTAKSDKGLYVLDYDYEAGFQRAPKRALNENDRVYVRVRRVQPGGSVAIAINDNGVVQHAVSLVGIPQNNTGTSPAQGQTATPSTDPALSVGQRSSFNELDPEQVVVQANSTQILSLSGFEGAKRYELTLCALNGRDQVCPPPKDGTKGRIIARNSIVVHAKRYLGVRAGLGFTGTFGDVRTLVNVPDSTTLKYVRGVTATTDFSVPLLLTYYPTGRDAVDLPRDWKIGVGAGVDMVKLFQSRPKMYGAFVFDLWGFGLTGGLLVEGRDSVDAAAGRYVSNAQTTTRFYGGLFAGLTTDLDIFDVVFRKYILGTSNSPSVGGSP